METKKEINARIAKIKKEKIQLGNPHWGFLELAGGKGIAKINRDTGQVFVYLIDGKRWNELL